MDNNLKIINESKKITMLKNEIITSLPVIFSRNALKSMPDLSSGS